MNSSENPYEVRTQFLTIGELALTVRTLKDQNQYYDPVGLAEKIGITQSSWSSFGVIWQSAVILAELIASMPLEKLRILELGCGVALPSLVASKKGANVHVSDYHPLAEQFLEKNTVLNNLGPISYFRGDWRNPITQLGRFDLVIGSDILYEKEHPQILSSFINSHTKDSSEVIIVDSMHKHAKRFNKLMRNNGFDIMAEKVPENYVLDRRYKGKIYRYYNSNFS
jgi:predicted nicotinamide N-methyase